MAFEAVNLAPRHVGGVAEMSRQLIQQSAPAIEGLVREDLSHAVAAAVDAAIIAGSGTDGEPLGIMGRAGVQTADMPADWADILAIEQMLAAVNVDPSGWYTSPAVMTALRGTLKAASAGSEYIAGRASIGDLPAASSNAAPADTAILGDWSQVLLGQWVAKGRSRPPARGFVLWRPVANHHDLSPVATPVATPTAENRSAPGRCWNTIPRACPTT